MLLDRHAGFMISILPGAMLAPTTVPLKESVMNTNQWIRRLLLGIGTAGLAVAAVSLASTAVAQAATGSRAVTAARGSFGFGLVDMQALLAEALGIRVEELEAAQLEANEAAIQQLQEAGYLTDEQAELARAANRLKPYLDREALVAEALGMTVDDLDQAIQDGQTLSELLEQQGLDRATYAENLAAARSAAIGRAVEDGVITQDQADQLEDFHLQGFGPGHGWHGFPRGGSFVPRTPDSAPDVDTLFG
jgi:hypothetical protein